jgi:prepilin-type processing-associated H-X9-DG protein
VGGAAPRARSARKRERRCWPGSGQRVPVGRSGATDRSRQTTCLSHVRQLEQAYAEYLRQNGLEGLPSNPTPAGSWVAVVQSRLESPEEILQCPSASSEQRGFGSATASWTLTLGLDADPARVVGSYGFNGWLQTLDPKNPSADRFSGGTPAEHMKGLHAQDAGRIPVFGDCTWNDSWPRETDPTPPNLRGGDWRRQGWKIAPNENFMARFTIARHDKSVNVAFLDGHAEAVPLADLKELKWHEGFVYQDWQPPLPGH